MKKLRVFLSVSALIFAFGAAFASQFTVSTIGYRWIAASSMCRQLTTQDDCDTVNKTPCTVIDPADNVSVHLRRDNNAQTSCGPELFKP